jgi:hypothetical protein
MAGVFGRLWIVGHFDSRLQTRPERIPAVADSDLVSLGPYDVEGAILAVCTKVRGHIGLISMFGTATKTAT